MHAHNKYIQYACMYTHTYQIYTIHMYIHTHIQMHACVYIKININICIHEASTPAELSVTMMWTLSVEHLYTYYNLYMYIYSCKHNVHMYIYLCIHLCICVHKYIHMCVSTYLFVFLCICKIDKDIAEDRQSPFVCFCTHRCMIHIQTEDMYVIHISTFTHECIYAHT